MFFFKPQPGNLSAFSLIEVLVAISIVSALVIVVGQTYNTQFKIFLNQNAAIEAVTQNKIGIEEMTNTILESAGVAFTCPYTPAGYVCGSTAPPLSVSSSSNNLVLKFWPIDPTTQEAVDPGVNQSNFDYIIYGVSGDKLYKIVKPNNGTNLPNQIPTTRKPMTKIISGNITSVNFVYDNAQYDLSKKITITLNSESKNGSRTFTSSQTSDAVLRNK